ncbi:hypothetical protein [Kitasatospora sp. NPDC098663]|uniref:HNH endonuclease n=1 Tax=Kitasatospora sp. NPDC098663 TaxID=3364096 RepID=UPI0037F362B2
MFPVYGGRKASMPEPAGERNRLRHRRKVRRRLPGNLPVLPDARRCLPTSQAAIGPGNSNAQDSRKKARVDGVGDDGPPQGQDPHPSPAAHLFRGVHASRQQEGTGCTVRRDSFKTAEDGRADRLSDWPRLPQKELIRRLQGERCEVCEQTGEVEVHHIRSLNDLTRLDGPSPEWADLMAKRRRKALVVCGTCHERIHIGKPNPRLTQ